MGGSHKPGIVATLEHAHKEIQAQAHSPDGHQDRVHGLAHIPVTRKAERQPGEGHEVQCPREIRHCHGDRKKVPANSEQRQALIWFAWAQKQVLPPCSGAPLTFINLTTEGHRKEGKLHGDSNSRAQGQQRPVRP
jgi:hypothetical protein